MLRILVIENFTCSLPEGFGAGTQGEITTMYNLKVTTFTAAKYTITMEVARFEGR